MIELGGNINLDGFDSMEPSQLVVIKKIAGNYAKKISTKSNFEKLLISLKKLEDNRFQIQVKLTIKEKVNSAESEDSNLFFALDNTLAKILEETK